MNLRKLLHILPLLFFASFTAQAQDSRLTGLVMGTEQSVDYSTGAASTQVNTIACAFDGNPDTYFASYERSLTWAGLDLGQAHVITRVGWMPRRDGLGPKRTLLGVFEGANRPDFLDAVPLHVIQVEGQAGEMSSAPVSVSRGFRYVRYVGPHDARCNIAELAFYGHAGEGDGSRYYQLTNLPTVSIHTAEAVDPYDKEHNLQSQIDFIYDDGTRIQRQTGTSRLRGNASMSHPKKPYRIKFDLSSRIFKGSALQSPAKCKKWTLINNYSDKTLMRNIVAFEMGRRMGFSYVPWCQPVDVILNGEYRGNYQLTDQLTVDAHRVNIEEMMPEDCEGEALTGGYLVELDGYAESEASWFRSICGNPVTIKSPSDSEITPGQYEYIQNAFNEMEAGIMLHTPEGGPTDFRRHLDEESLMRYFLTEEVTGNPDAFWSCYLTKQRGEDFFRVGPIWDFDIAFDNDYRYFPVNDQGDFLSLARGGAGNSRALLKRIFRDQAFCDSLIGMWNEVRTSGRITPAGATALIDSLARELHRSQQLNFLRWPILGTKVQVNPRAAGSYEGEVQWLREFMQNRIPWLDRQVSNLADRGDSLFIEIGTPQEMADFALQVNNGKEKARGRLTADIDLTDYPALMIGTSANGFAGEFDGAGHTVTLAMKRSAEHAALFCSLSGSVHDLTVKGSISTSAKYAAGIAANMTGGSIARCQSLVTIHSTVQGDGTHGGIAGVTGDNAVIESCLVNVSMQGEATTCCGGVVGWASSATSVRNCLVTGDVNVSASGSDLLSRNAGSVQSDNNYVHLPWDAASDCGGVTRLDASQLQLGAACYMLNKGETTRPKWFQTIGRDALPVPDNRHRTVYSTAHLHCDGTPYTSMGNYTNDIAGSNRDAHRLVDGVCKVCGRVDIDYMPCDERGFFMLSTPVHLLWFAQQTESGETGLCAVLTADIDMSRYPGFMIGRTRIFAGVLDGAGHSVTIAQEETSDYAGLIGHLSGRVQDMVLRGSVTTSRKYAGMVGELCGGELLRCQSYLDIRATIDGDGTHGGLVGLVAESDEVGAVRDCLFAGSISGGQVNSCGGLVGWSSSLYVLSDCLMLGDMDVDVSGSNMLARNPGTAILSNCYYCSPWLAEVPRNARPVSQAEQQDGSLCYLLNRGVTDGRQAWYQMLGDNPYPLPDKRLPVVYYVDGTYTNTLPDAIASPMATAVRSADDRIYDLSGRRVTRPLRGIYVQGGRLIVK